MKHVLVTGATGTLGPACINALLNSPEKLVSVLVRADSSVHASRRLNEALRVYNIGVNRIHKVFVGDLGSSLDFLSTNPPITHVLNVAGNTSYSSLPEVRKTNIADTYEFAKRMSRLPNLQRFIHTSTAYLFDNTCVSTGTNVHENDFPKKECENSHFVEYTRSKSDAERALQTILPAHFPLIIARPSIIVGHSQLGCLPSGSIFWAFRMMAKSGVFPCHPSCQIDVVPIDYVAKSLVTILFSEKCEHKVYHISSGLNSCNFGDISFAIRNFANKNNNKQQKQELDIIGTSYDLISRVNQSPHLLEHPNQQIKRWLLQAMKSYMYFGGMGITFDNQRLLNEFCAPPPPFTTYIEKCMKFPQIAIAEQFMEDLGMVKER